MGQRCILHAVPIELIVWQLRAENSQWCDPHQRTVGLTAMVSIPGQTCVNGLPTIKRIACKPTSVGRISFLWCVGFLGYQHPCQR